MLPGEIVAVLKQSNEIQSSLTLSKPFSGFHRMTLKDLSCSTCRWSSRQKRNITYDRYFCKYAVICLGGIAAIRDMVVSNWDANASLSVAAPCQFEKTESFGNFSVVSKVALLNNNLNPP